MIRCSFSCFLPLFPSSQRQVKGTYSPFFCLLATISLRIPWEHPAVADTLDNLVRVYSERGKYAHALLLSREALEILEAILGKQNKQIAITLEGIAYLQFKQKKYVYAI